MGNALNAACCSVLDIEECDLNTDGCDQLCENTDGNFTCSCEDGFAVSATDPKICEGIP